MRICQADDKAGHSLQKKLHSIQEKTGNVNIYVTGGKVA